MENFSTIPQKYFFQFPWLNGSDEILFDMLEISEKRLETLSVDDFVRKLFLEYPELKESILKFFNNAVESKEYFSTSVDSVIHLAMYPLLQIITSMVKNRVLANSLSNIFAKQCKEKLYGAKSVADSLLKDFCQNIGIKCELADKFIDKIKYSFKMDFYSYLSVSTKINSDSWKLINRHFIEGKIYLIRPDMVMLLREFVRLKVRPDFSEVDSELSERLEKIPEISEIIKEIEELIKNNTKRFNSSFFSDGEKIGSDLFAPCIKVILHKAIQGENLSHNERLAISFYFLNTNHSVEETVDIFRTLPDFNDSIARYQVEFAAGKGGKGKKYKMYNCSKLKSLHMCQANNPEFGEDLCKNGAKKRNGDIVKIINPAKDYLFWKKVILNRIHRSQVAAGEKVIGKNKKVDKKDDTNQKGNKKIRKSQKKPERTGKDQKKQGRT